LYAWYFYSPKGHPVRIRDAEEGRKLGDEGRIGAVIDKETLYRCLLQEVKARGVDVFPGVDVNKVTSIPDGVKVEGSGQTFEGTYCIAADGVNSRIAHMLGFNKDRYYWCNLIVISFYMSGVEAPDPNIVITSSGYLKTGRSLFFMAPRPFEGEYNVQFLTIDPRVDLKEAADHFFNKTFTASWFKNARTLRTLSAICSCYDPIEEPFKNNVLVIADAASTQEIENTGAMICGWKAGQCVATAVREKKFGLEVTGISRYLDWWKKAFIEGYDHEAYMKNWVLPFVLTEAEDMSYAFGLIKEPIMANFNPYSAPKMMGRTMGQLAPTIQKERPDIFQKLGRLRIPLKEVYAEVTKISKPVIG
jgi:flavin-dependent dehydrogenase